MIDRTVSHHIVTTLALAVVVGAAIPAIAATAAEPVTRADVLGVDGNHAKTIARVSSILMVDPAIAGTYPNLAGGACDEAGNGLDGSDQRFVDDVAIVTIPGASSRPGYMPECPSCSRDRAVEFGNTSPFLAADSAGTIYTQDYYPYNYVYQVAEIDPSLVDEHGRLTGFTYYEQHEAAEVPTKGKGSILGQSEGRVRFLDPDGDGDHDLWRVEHAGQTVGTPGEYGPAAFTLDIDIVTADLNGDGKHDVATVNDLFDVWGQLTGNPDDLQGQVYLPLVDAPGDPGMRTIRFNDTALDSATVAGGPLPIIAPVAGGVRAPAIPTAGSWGVALLLALMAVVGWSLLRRGGLAAA